MSTTHPYGRADRHPSNKRPKLGWKFLGCAAISAGLVLAGLGTAGASVPQPQPGQSAAPIQPPPGVDSSTWDYQAATPIACWIPQAPGWTPAPSFGTTPQEQAWYASWLASNVRLRSWDHRYEVAVKTDRGSAPFCVDVLPGEPELWVYVADVPFVQAYLVGLNR